MLGGRYLQEKKEGREEEEGVVEVEVGEEVQEELEGPLWMDLGWTATGLVDGCSRRGSAPGPHVFI